MQLPRSPTVRRLPFALGLASFGGGGDLSEFAAWRLPLLLFFSCQACINGSQLGLPAGLAVVGAEGWASKSTVLELPQALSL